MAGIRPEQRSPADTAYGILWFLTMISWFALPLLIIGYVVLAIVRAKAARLEGSSPPSAGAPG